MDVNPYESPASAQEAGFLRVKFVASYFTIYRAVVLGSCAAVLGMSHWMSYVLGLEHVSRDLYVIYLGMIVWAMLALLLLPFRFLYLLTRFRFQQAAIDAVLVIALFLSIARAQSLVGVAV